MIVALAFILVFATVLIGHYVEGVDLDGAMTGLGETVGAIVGAVADLIPSLDESQARVLVFLTVALGLWHRLVGPKRSARKSSEPSHPSR